MCYDVAKAPCASCPYRKDTPSGVWDASEYDKLPTYDGEMFEQVLNGAIGVFLCHQADGCLCAGWVGCHGAENLLALRLQGERVAPGVWDYESPVPLFASGQEACDHGMQEVEEPGDEAKRVIDRLTRKRGLL